MGDVACPARTEDFGAPLPVLPSVVPITYDPPGKGYYCFRGQKQKETDHGEDMPHVQS